MTARRDVQGVQRPVHGFVQGQPVELIGVCRVCRVAPPYSAGARAMRRHRREDGRVHAHGTLHTLHTLHTPIRSTTCATSAVHRPLHTLHARAVLPSSICRKVEW